VSAGDVADGNGEGIARGESEEEAAWRELIGRFDATGVPADAPVPWPERENVEPPPPPPWPERENLAPPALPAPSPPAPAPLPPASALPPPPPALPPPPATPAAAQDVTPLEEEHYEPPPPPPLPTLSPVAKGAWVGLFGGPGYLLVATMAGWSVPGWLAFCAVAAFIGGFTVLVLRVGDDRGGDSDDDDDDGAVV
jgi:hypothetical protein